VLPLIITSPEPSAYSVKQQDRIVLDFETTNTNHGNACDKRNKLVLSATVVPGGQPVVMAADEYMLGYIDDRVKNKSFIVGHNIKFDLKWMIRAGIDVSNMLVWDTMLAEYVIHGNQKFTRDLGLGKVAEAYGLPGKDAYIDSCIKGGVCPSELPLSLMINRAAYDVNTTDAVFLKQLAIAEQRGLRPAIYTKCLATVVLAYIEMNGVHLDKEKVNDIHKSTTEDYHRVSTALSRHTGGINPRSSTQLAEFMYGTLGFREPTKRSGGKVVPDRTDSGARRTDAATVGALVPKTKEQKEFVTLKRNESKLGAALSKTLNTFKDTLDSGTDILYANFNQTQTKTHRLSSTGAFGGVQFQNMPREFKKLMSARHDGWLVGEADYAQLEFRVAAFLGNDEVAIDDINNGTDVHRFTASVINGVSEDAVTPEMRQSAKADTFKPLYAGESGTDEQVAYYEAFKQKYKGIARAQDLWAAEVGANKRKRLPTGVCFYYPTATFDKKGRLSCKTEVYNHPIQYLATAEIAIIGLIYLFHTLRSAQAQTFLVNTVHDAAVAEVHPDEVDLFKGCCERSFVDYTLNYLTDVYGIEFNVPLSADVKVGTNWGK